MFIGIAGPIGVGKTTLTTTLAKHLDFDAYYEPVETNPYLADFYQDMARWTFPMQMHLLAKRFEQHQEVVWNPCHREGRGVVQDRTIYEDTIFARMHHEDGIMSDREYETYTSHFRVMRRYLVYPDVVLYLRCPPELAAQRIRDRRRSAEADIPFDYLEKLHAGYERFAADIAEHTTVVTLDWTAFQSAPVVAESIRTALRARPYARSLLRG